MFDLARGHVDSDSRCKTAHHWLRHIRGDEAETEASKYDLHVDEIGSIEYVKFISIYLVSLNIICFVSSVG